MTSSKNGVSANGLQDALRFGSYETAWAWLHKLRRAMVRPDRQLLGGDPSVVVAPGATIHTDRGPHRARGLLFYRVLQQAVDSDPHPLKDLIGG